MVTFIQLSGDMAQSDGTNHMTAIAGWGIIAWTAQ
jgi:hypothetical protein